MLLFAVLLGAPVSAHDDWQATEYSRDAAHVPTPLPDRVVLTWEDDPATTQSVTWRTDASTKKGLAHIAVANANGRALQPEVFQAETEYFKSDINEANYHSVTFRNLMPDTLYAYRVGDGVNWTEYYHFKPQVTKQSRLASFILVMPRMKSVLIGRVCFERHFATPQERRSRCMRAT